MSRTTVLVETTLGVGADVGVGPAELVATDALELGVELLDGGHELTRSFVSIPASGMGWCRPRRRGRWWPGAARAGDQADRLGLGLAQLRELVGDVGDRAVLLAQLLPHGHARGPRRRTLVGKTCARPRPTRASGGRGRPGTASRDERRTPRRERPHRVGTAGLGEEAQRLGTARSSYCWSKGRGRPRSARRPSPAARARGPP